MKAIRGALCSALLLVLAAPAGALGSSPARVHAKLKPIAPVQTGSGSFAASAVETKGTVKLKWQLSLSHLSGSATKATLRLTGLRGVAFVLCKPCSASGHGQVGLVSSVWDDMLAHGAQLVVATRAHPQGELRGTISRR